MSRVLIISGEASGDNYASMLVNEIRKSSPALEIWAVGGDLVQDAGAKLISHYSEISVVGIFEVLGKLPKILSLLGKIKGFLRNHQIDCLVLIDFPDFNFQVGKYAKKYNIPVIYYIPPQAWAWRENRVHTIRSFTKKIVVPFPFEVEFFRKFDIPVDYFGHPLVELIRSKQSLKPHKSTISDHEGESTVKIGLFPGSRDTEVDRLLPHQLRAAKIVEENRGDVEFIIPVASRSLMDRVERIVSGSALSKAKIVMKEYPAIRSIDAAVASSGTVTLELALFGVPTVVIYKVSPLTYIIGKSLIKVESIGLPNILAGEKVFPELVQNEVSGSNIARELNRIIDDSDMMNKAEVPRGRLMEELTGSSPSQKVADMVVKEM